MILAIDQGTTSTRALRLEADGTHCLVHVAEHRQHYPRPGHVEHDASEILRDVAACLDAAANRGDIAAIGIDNQGETCLGWDADTGEPVGPAIVWQDDRTAELTERLRADGTEPLVLERAGLPLDPYFSASKLGWIVRENEKARRLAEKGRLRLGTTDAFFRDRLTGRFETDVTTASRTSLMALDTCTWDAELCALFGVPIEALPAVGPSSGDLGMVRCAGRDVPLTASLVDQQAALYGHGCRAPGDAKITCGTGAFMLAVTGPDRPSDATGALPTVLWQREGEAPVYGLDGGVYAAAAAVNWARGIGLFAEFSEIGAFERPPAIMRGLAFVPALSGLACPHWNRAARGAFLGMSLDTERADMAQAVLEGVALRIAEVARSMTAAAPLSSPVALDGGMSANPWFTQFLADAISLDLRVSDMPEVTALGTAIMASELAGHAVTPLTPGYHVTAQQLPNDVFDRFTAAIDSVRYYARSGLGQSFGGSERLKRPTLGRRSVRWAAPFRKSTKTGARLFARHSSNGNVMDPVARTPDGPVYRSLGWSRSQLPRAERGVERHGVGDPRATRPAAVKKLPQGSPQVLRYLVGCRSYGFRCKVGVARGGLHLRVAEELADHRQALAGGHSGRGKRVAQVVDADVLHPGAGAHAPPERLQIAQALALQVAGDDPRVAIDTVGVAEQFNGGLAEMDELGAGLGVRQAQGAVGQVDVGPLQRHDLAQPAARQDQEPRGEDG